jgi:hypothetical protein
VGVIRTQPETRRLLREALQEVYGLALRAGIALPADAVARTLEFIDGLPADGTTSMQRDVLAGRPSKVGAQVGAVVRLGERLGLEVPVHRVIYAALVPQDRRALGRCSGDSTFFEWVEPNFPGESPDKGFARGGRTQDSTPGEYIFRFLQLTSRAGRTAWRLLAVQSSSSDSVWPAAV